MPKLWRWRQVGNFAELILTVTCRVLKAKAKDRRTSRSCHDELRGPRSDYVRQVALATTKTRVERFGTIGVKLYKKGSKRYRIFMTMFDHTFAVKPRQIQKTPLGNVKTPTVQSGFVTLGLLGL
ncbi:hypothetical protein TNCV_1710151 [Trichonephila clavipes]|nr:hypothetical protein TNCV_1710151 [Trichonephila clavipes]